MISELWDYAFVVSLKSRQDRREHAIQNAKEVGFTFEFFDAIDKNQIVNYTELRDGEFALLNSYLGLLTEIENSILKNSRILILEDDFEFTTDYKFLNDRKIILTINDLSYPLVYLGGNHRSLGAGKLPPKFICSSENLELYEIYSSFGAHAIITTPESRSAIKDKILQFDRPLDVMYTDLQKSMGAIGIFPSLCKQYDSVSDIIGYNPQYNKQGVFN